MEISPTFISVIVPAKNEADNIGLLVTEIITHLSLQYKFEIIYIDDGSADLTAEKVLGLMSVHPNILRLIQHEQSVGQSTAIYTGVRHALGELIVTIDADGQNNPADITYLISLPV